MTVAGHIRVADPGLSRSGLTRSFLHQGLRAACIPVTCCISLLVQGSLASASYRVWLHLKHSLCIAPESIMLLSAAWQAAFNHCSGCELVWAVCCPWKPLGCRARCHIWTNSVQFTQWHNCGYGSGRMLAALEHGGCQFWGEILDGMVVMHRLQAGVYTLCMCRRLLDRHTSHNTSGFQKT